LQQGAASAWKSETPKHEACRWAASGARRADPQPEALFAPCAADDVQQR
jgi:hypothetical protein